jgi:hypothetical protein
MLANTVLSADGGVVLVDIASPRGLAGFSILPRTLWDLRGKNVHVRMKCQKLLVFTVKCPHTYGVGKMDVM